ncbi:serine/threonine-protein phosphatase 1 regulatory subunit 10, partial [Apteryx rowi]|uniref:serine/threonine-protein phosphatase 1 regulatory subunit 10 n=1 Tax=Apteryx rowi TaxID=308060 RepID=UPI000E1C9A3F
MGSGPIDPKELLKGLDCFLGRDGEVKNAEGITKIFNLMKDSQKMVSRCIYLNILLQTRAQDVLAKFIRVGGYKLLNTWLTGSKAANNVPFLQQILLTLQHLPLTVDHLKQVSAFLLAQNKSKTPAQEKPQEAKAEAKAEEMPEKKREKPKSLRTTAPSHAKFRSTGLEMETPSLAPVKKMNSASTTDKYNLKPMPIKRQNASALSGDNPPAEKKYKPLNTTPNTTKEIKVKIIPPQPMEGLGFLDALNSAPIPGIKIKKKKKVLSPTAAKPSPFEGKPVPEASAAKPSSPEPAATSEPMETDRPGTPVPAVEVPEPMETASAEQGADGKAAEGCSDASQLTKKGRKRKTVSWPEESKLREYFYFELDETERVNVNKIKDFGEAAKREMLMDRHAFETARRLSHDAMEEKVPWAYPKLLELPAPLVLPGSGSRERFTQAEREKGILQELFLSKERCVPPEFPPRPSLVSACRRKRVGGSLFGRQNPAAALGSPEPPLPPALCAAAWASVPCGALRKRLRSRIAPRGISWDSWEQLGDPFLFFEGGGGCWRRHGAPHPRVPPLNTPLLSFSPPTVPHGLLGPGPMANGFPPGPKGMQHFPPGGPGPMPGPHGGGGGGPGLPPGPGMPGGPRLLGPPPPQRGDFWEP